MKIETDDSLAPKIDIDEKEAMELLAIALYKYKGIHGSLAGKLIGKTEGSLWIPDWAKRTTVDSTMTDDGTGSLFSTITASYTTPFWLSEKANLRKIS